MAKQIWLKCLLVGIGLWVVGLVVGALSAPLVSALPAIGIILIPVDWLVMGFAAIKLVKWVG